MRFLPFFLFAVVASAQGEEQGSPFEFKKPAPPAPVVAAITSDMDLTEKQKSTVMSMISSVAETLKIAPEKNVPFDVDGRRYLLLEDKQSYVGAMNGQHIVFDQISKDYIYHAVSDINKIIRVEEFERMKEDAATELDKLQRSLMQGVSDQESMTSEPMNVVSSDQKKARTEKANQMISNKPILNTNPIVDKGN